MRSSPNRVVATITGAAFVLFGAAGFLVTGTMGFFGVPGRLLLWVFEVNPAQNVAHIVIGAALIACGLIGVRAARIADVTVGTLLLAVGLAGLFVIGTVFNVIALNGAANVLHLAAASLLLAVGLGSDRPDEAE